jgi:hypothetical protein
LNIGVETLSTLFGSLRAQCAALPDKRRGANGRYTMANVGMAAFSVFFMQSRRFSRTSGTWRRGRSVRTARACSR